MRKLVLAHHKYTAGLRSQKEVEWYVQVRRKGLRAVLDGVLAWSQITKATTRLLWVHQRH